LIACEYQTNTPVMSEAAITFLRKHGNQSLVSLGCGNWLNRLDNHIRLFVECGLKYYVAVDRVTEIDYSHDSVCTDRITIDPLLKSYYSGKPERFFDNLHTFPNTFVEELTDIPCKVVICQRVLPFRHWEDVIKSMTPNLILQEDLNGCEKQAISGEQYKKTFPGIVHFKLQPFRPTHLLPSEKNIILWRRRDFFPCHYDTKPWWSRLLFRLFWRKHPRCHY